MRSVHGSVEKLQQSQIQKMLEVKVVPKIKVKE